VQGAAILVCGEVSKREEQPKLVAREIHPLSDAPKLLAQRLGIHIPAAKADHTKLEKIKDILHTHQGNTPVVICLQFPSGEKVFLDTDLSLKVLPDDKLIHVLEHELGENCYHIAVTPTGCGNDKPNGNNHKQRYRAR